MQPDSRHALRFLGTGFNGLGYVDEESLIGASEELDHRWETASLPDGHTVVSVLGTLPQCSHNIHKDLHTCIHTCRIEQCNGSNTNLLLPIDLLPSQFD